MVDGLLGVTYSKNLRLFKLAFPMPGTHQPIPNACAKSLIGVTHSVSGSAPNISRRRVKAKNLACLNTSPFAGDAPQRTLAEGLAQGDTESVICFCTSGTFCDLIPLKPDREV